MHSARTGGARTAAVAVLTAVLLAGCGSGKTGAPKRTARQAFAAFSVCMRSHGVTNFPDPSAGGGIQLSDSINPFSPSFKTAHATCRHLMPGGGPPSGPPSAHDIAQAAAMSECMRKHGVNGFPDPTTTQPANPQNYSILEDRGGVILGVPKTIDPTSPVFQQASKACGFR
jgi:hypothetical protein